MFIKEWLMSSVSPNYIWAEIAEKERLVVLWISSKRKGQVKELLAHNLRYEKQ